MKILKTYFTVHSARSAILMEIGCNIYKYVKEEEKNGLYRVLLAI